MPGEVSFILPCLGRTEIDRNSKGVSQIVTVEDSMSMVHGSGGINKPASPELRSEVAIIAGIAAATVGSVKVAWAALADDYDLIRNHSANVIPGFENYNERVRKPRGFHLRNAAANREWETPAGPRHLLERHASRRHRTSGRPRSGRRLRAADLPLARPVQYDHLRHGRSLSWRLWRTQRRLHQSRRPR